MRLALASALLVMLVACGGAQGGAGSPSASVGDVARGEVLYQANCASCHGVDLRGTDQGPPHLDPVYLPNHHADITFRLAVANGVRPHHWRFGPMPPIEGLDDEDVTAIIAYVRAQQRAAGMLE